MKKQWAAIAAWAAAPQRASLLLMLRGHCMTTQKSEPCRVTEAEEQRSSLQKTEDTVIQHQSKEELPEKQNKIGVIL